MTIPNPVMIQVVKKTDISDKAIVCIDASHGGSDTGQYDGKNYEKTQVLELAGLVEKKSC